MTILAIDTASYVMGVALVKDGVPLGEMMTYEKKNHSVRLMPAVRKLFAETDVKPEDLERIVVSAGPGSYTGVRIGVTTAKTMAWALGVPVTGISSMAVLARNGRHFPGFISPFFDARRGQVFTGLYQGDGTGVARMENDRIIMHNEWLDFLQEEDKPVLFLSPDMEKHEVMIREKLGDRAVFGSASDCLPRPLELALAGMAAETAQTDKTHGFSPRYLRLAEAEAKWLEANKDNNNQ